MISNYQAENVLAKRKARLLTPATFHDPSCLLFLQFLYAAPLIASISTLRIKQMPGLTLNNLDPLTQNRLRLKAAQHGRSMEDEATILLREKLEDESTSDPVKEPHILHQIRAAVEKYGGVDIELPSRKSIRPPFEFDK